MVLVVHHLEEIPPGFDHALLLAGGRVVAAGAIEAVVASEPMSAAFGRPLVVTRRDGRWTATGLRSSVDSGP
jgi:iron complex transport system ATP-binding protein